MRSPEGSGTNGLAPGSGGAGKPPSTSPATGTPPPEQARARVLPGAFTHLSFAAVTVVLVLLLVLPILVRQRSDQIRLAATEVAEPARDLSQDIDRDVAVQVAAARGYALTGKPELLLRYRAAADHSASAFGQLQGLASMLGPGPGQAVAQLRAALTRWQNGTRMGAGATPAEVAAATRADLQEQLFQTIIQAAGHLDDAIGVAVQAKREEARSIDNAAVIITMVLIALVLLSVTLLARLGRQLWLLADEAQRRAQHEARLRRELEAAMESRARLIRGFSHDVRNPLGAADGYVQLLEGGVYGQLGERQLESLERVRRSIGSAVVLTDDLLDLARLEAGQMQLEIEAVDVGVLTAETTEEYRGQAETAGLAMEVQTPAQPARVRSDPRRMHQVLGNLISNAIKYTPEGGRVRVLVESRTGAGAPGPGEWIALEVSDTGIGIEAEQRSRVFDEFTRAEPEVAPGIGLGLAISRRLARALGGDITLESETGAGSTFTFWLPVNPRT